MPFDWFKFTRSFPFIEKSRLTVIWNDAILSPDAEAKTLLFRIPGS